MDLISRIIEDIEIDFSSQSLETLRPPRNGASRTTVCGWVALWLWVAVRLVVPSGVEEG